MKLSRPINELIKSEKNKINIKEKVDFVSLIYVLHEIPKEEKVGHMGEERYKKLDSDGLIQLEQYAGDKEIVIGRTSPPRFLEEISEFGVVQEKRRESSMATRKGKPGFVDKVIITENEDGNRIAKINKTPNTFL